MLILIASERVDVLRAHERLHLQPLAEQLRESEGGGLAPVEDHHFAQAPGKVKDQLRAVGAHQDELVECLFELNEPLPQQVAVAKAAAHVALQSRVLPRAPG